MGDPQETKAQRVTAQSVRFSATAAAAILAVILLALPKAIVLLTPFLNVWGRLYPFNLSAIALIVVLAPRPRASVLGLRDLTKTDMCWAAAGVAVAIARLTVMNVLIPGDKGALSAGAALLLLPANCIFAPLMEELCFRAMVLPPLIGLLGPGIGILADVALFTLAHRPADVIEVLGYVVIGFVYSAQFYKTGNTWVAIITHAISNLLAFVW